MGLDCLLITGLLQMSLPSFLSQSLFSSEAVVTLVSEFKVDVGTLLPDVDEGWFTLLKRSIAREKAPVHVRFT